MNPKMRPLWRRRAETAEGEVTLWRARQLSKMPAYAHLSDAELIRLAYWGASGEPDIEGRKAQVADIAAREAAVAAKRAARIMRVKRLFGFGLAA